MSFRVPEELKGALTDRIKTTIRVDRYIWELFKNQCKRVGLSTCFVLENLMRAWTTGETREIPRARPVTIDMKVNYKVERPRRRAPQEIERGLQVQDLRRILGACHRLDIRTDQPGRIGYCYYHKKWLLPGACQGCRHQGEF